MILLMLRTAPSRDGSPASATRRMGRTLRTLVPKLDTKKLENKPKRHDSKYIYIQDKHYGNVRIRDT